MSVTIRDVMTDPALFGGQFGGDTWAAWRALLSGFYGLPLDDAEAQHWHALTDRESAPQSAHDELWLVVGRRGGKSNAAALLAVYEACFKDHRDALAPGEVATTRVMAADRAQARSVFRYISGLMHANPMLERLIVREDRESIELSNRAVIEVGTASFRTTRGYTFAAVIADEVAFWRSDDSANPDSEIIAAVRPGLATLNGKLIALSSPYARRGELWENYRRHYGKASPILVAQAPSRTMNPSLPERVVTEAMERDPASAAAEYLAEFRTDVETFLQREVVEAATRPTPLELPYNKRVTYTAFVDPAGGGADEFTAAIGHREGERVVVDVLRARKGTPAEIVAEYADLLKSYRITRAISDRYAGSWPADEFSRHGITVEQAAKPKSDLYRDMLASMNSARVELPPDDRLMTQLISLERRTARGGRDSIDHAPGGHDDRANAVAGLVAANSRAPGERMRALCTW
ncbi:hypothetical protein ACN2MM_05980 [Alkalilimnicola ehrlichii MLHE-1]|uniref:Terminase n=1 Tax=Alkalilimnicola ehrlichii (strain ATCC BAA-1101 / DSM 17681 / MLHE-1) TaxID=187272 RepID=Q0A9R9_ALKEH|nr:hypothetical protein [Alkalilimnicola ehrlichii]ABI56418.1 hypothetical protein Mlg_1066 [Alkalilimnicola ehrlichii MLHE-1]